jgi:hypothetical protein
VRTGTWISLGLAGILLLALPPFPKDIQAWGNNLAATVVMAVALGWHLLHPVPRENAGPDGATELQASQ